MPEFDFDGEPDDEVLVGIYLGAALQFEYDDEEHRWAGLRAVYDLAAGRVSVPPTPPTREDARKAAWAAHQAWVDMPPADPTPLLDVIADAVLALITKEPETLCDLCDEPIRADARGIRGWVHILPMTKPNTVRRHSATPSHWSAPEERRST